MESQTICRAVLLVQYPFSLCLPQRYEEDDGEEQACQWNSQANVGDNVQSKAVHLVEEQWRTN